MTTMIPEKYRLARLLAGLCLIFLLLLGLEWIFGGRDLSQVGREPAEGGDKPLTDPAAVPEVGDFVLPGIEAYAEMVERPLFLEGRKPLEQQQDATVSVVDEVPVNLEAKLMGVIVTPEGMMALMLDSQGKYKKAKKGDEVDGWQVEAIYEDRVTLSDGAAPRDLYLRKPKPKVAPRVLRPRTQANLRARNKGTETDESDQQNEEDQDDQAENGETEGAGG